jgi:hypothetical protein
MQSGRRKNAGMATWFLRITTRKKPTGTPLAYGSGAVSCAGKIGWAGNAISFFKAIVYYNIITHISYMESTIVCKGCNLIGCQKMHRPMPQCVAVPQVRVAKNGYRAMAFQEQRMRMDAIEFRGDFA